MRIYISVSKLFISPYFCVYVTMCRFMVPPLCAYMYCIRKNLYSLERAGSGWDSGWGGDSDSGMEEGRPPWAAAAAAPVMLQCLPPLRSKLCCKRFPH